MAELHCGPDGVVTAVPGSHDRLRLDDRCVGRPIAELGHWLRSADGRPLWAIDASSTAPGVAVRVVVLSDAAPVRGSRGAIVRCVYVRTDSGVTVFVAADEMHDRPAGPATPVDLRSGR